MADPIASAPCCIRDRRPACHLPLLAPMMSLSRSRRICWRMLKVICLTGGRKYGRWATIRFLVDSRKNRRELAEFRHFAGVLG